MKLSKLSLFGVIIGVVVDHIGTIITSTIISVTYVIANRIPITNINLIYRDDILLCIFMAVGLFWSCFGGYASARIAKRSEYINSSIIGIVCTATAIYGLFTHSVFPLWYQIFGLITVIPVSMLGGYVAIVFERKSQLRS